MQSAVHLHADMAVDALYARVRTGGRTYCSCQASACDTWHRLQADGLCVLGFVKTPYVVVCYIKGGLRCLVQLRCWQRLQQSAPPLTNAESNALCHLTATHVDVHGACGSQWHLQQS